MGNHYDFGMKWMGIPIGKINREEFIDDYYSFLGPTTKKQSCVAILNELSRIFIITRPRAYMLDINTYDWLEYGENYYLIKEAKKDDK